MGIDTKEKWRQERIERDRKLYRGGRDKLILDLQRLQKDAADIGLFETMHAINKAMNICGWELVRKLEKNRGGK